MDKKGEISFLNVILCLMVIFIHVTSAAIYNLSPTCGSVIVLYALYKFCGFAVYGFVFLSGMKLFLNKSGVVNLKSYYVSRFKKIYIPYILFTVIYYLFKIRFVFYDPSYTFNMKDLLLYILNGNVECHLYFIIIIMQFYLLLPFWHYLTGFKAKIVLPVAFIINVICALVFSFYVFNDRIFTTYLFYWILGCFCGKYYERFKNFLAEKRKNIIWIYVIFCVLNIMLSYLSYTKILPVDAELMEIINILFCIASVIFFYKLSFKVYKWKIFDNRFVNAISNASFEIYLSHILFVHMINRKLHFTKGLGVIDAYIIRFVFVYIVGIAACLIYKKAISMLKCKINK